MALVPLKCSDVVKVSSAQVDENEVLVKDWVSDTCSESFELPTVGGLSPLSVGTTGHFSTLGNGKAGSVGCGESSVGRSLL